jgi:methyl-accepting chemotaxis protein
MVLLAVAVAFATFTTRVLRRQITVSLGLAVAALLQVAEGDLTASFEVDSTDEVGRMAQALNSALEKLRITSTVVTTEGRAVFSKMVTGPASIDGAAGMLKKPDHRSYFNVLVDGYQGGKFSIFSQFTPVQTVNV